MKHLFQAGIGSGGIVVLDAVARDPSVGRVTLVDPDLYKQRNVHRHLFPISGVGRTKCELAVEWFRERRPELRVDAYAIDLTAPEQGDFLHQVIAECDVGICAVDNETAKYRFDELMRHHKKPWALGEVLSGGIGGWIHSFPVGGACYGCASGRLQREGPKDDLGMMPDYAAPGPIRETSIPASRASVQAIAALHALAVLDLLDHPYGEESMSLLMPLQQIPDIFEEALRPCRVRTRRSLGCLVCSTEGTTEVEDLDAALTQALARLGDVGPHSPVATPCGRNCHTSRV